MAEQKGKINRIMLCNKYKEIMPQKIRRRGEIHTDMKLIQFKMIKKTKILVCI